eukprot:jgi/Hompol1/424/HPOL_000141-RA
MVQTRVPLWLALALKSKDRCTIVPPEWLSTARLEEKLSNEKTEASFSELPLHFLEIGFALLDR